MSSIPALLHTLQNEWDALVLETFTLKQQYNATRQELSYALYAQDASVRVAARLIKERDASREALGSVQASMGLPPTATPALSDIEMVDTATPNILPQETLNIIEDKHEQLSAARKKRKAPAGSATVAQVKNFTSKHTVPSLHSTSAPGITSIALSHANPGQFLTGGNDKVVQLYDRTTDKVLAELKGHSKRVNRVALREQDGEVPLILSAGADKLAKVWALDSASNDWLPRSTIRTHKGEVTGLAVHPTQTLALLSSLDGTYSVQDLNTFKQLYVSPAGDVPFTALQCHPDGSLLGIGTATSTVLIYDLRSASVAASLTIPDESFSVGSLSFAENGYQLLAPSGTSTVAVWDLRNQKTTTTIDLGDDFTVSNVAYDHAVRLLGVAGSGGLRVFAHKSWEEVVSFEEGGEVTDFAFGPLSQEIWGASGREVRIWGASD
jgi:pre-mRNA-processing factor 19